MLREAVNGTSKIPVGDTSVLALGPELMICIEF